MTLQEKLTLISDVLTPQFFNFDWAKSTKVNVSPSGDQSANVNVTIETKNGELLHASWTICLEQLEKSYCQRFFLDQCGLALRRMAEGKYHSKQFVVDKNEPVRDPIVIINKIIREKIGDAERYRYEMTRSGRSSQEINNLTVRADKADEIADALRKHLRKYHEMLVRLAEIDARGKP